MFLNLPPGFAVFASGEVACVRLAITNKFASHSLTRNFILFKKRESFLFINPPLCQEEGDRLRWRR